MEQRLNYKPKDIKRGKNVKQKKSWGPKFNFTLEGPKLYYSLKNKKFH